MSDYEALYLAVTRNPDDDVPRLVLADWLEENGHEERAHFIRTQLEYASIAPWEPLRVRVDTFDPDLAVGLPFAHALPRLPYAVNWTEQPFHRGFPWSIRLSSLLGILDTAGQLFECHPIGSVQLPSATLEEWKAVGRSPWLKKIKSIRFFGTKTPVEPMRVLAASPHSRGLESIHFENAGGPGFDDIVAGLVQSPVGPQLRSLSFNSGGGWLTDLLDALSSSPMPALKELLFQTMNFSEAEAVWFADSPVLDRLQRLVLINNPVGGGLKTLLQSPRLRNLQSLVIRNCGVTLSDVESLLSSHFVTGLCQLDLSQNSLSAEALFAITQHDLPGLRALKLRQTGLDNGTVWALTQAAFWDRLVELDLGQNWLSDEGARFLMGATFPWDLTAIRLDRNSFLSPTQTMLELHFPERVVLRERSP